MPPAVPWQIINCKSSSPPKVRDGSLHILHILYLPLHPPTGALHPHPVPLPLLCPPLHKPRGIRVLAPTHTGLGGLSTVVVILVAARGALTQVLFSSHPILSG